MLFIIDMFEEIFKNLHEKVDTEEGESIEEEEKFTTSEEFTEDEYSTFSDMSRQDSESDINVDETQNEQNPHTPKSLQIHNTNNTTMHDRNDLIQLKLKLLKTMGRKFMKQKSQYLWKHLKFLLYSTKQYIMKMIHQMTNL